MNQAVQPRAGEEGAVTLKTLFMYFLVGMVILAVIKIVPVYTEQRQVIFDVDELANKSAVRNMKADEVKKAITDLTSKYALPNGSINLIAYGENKAQIAISYKKPIDFFVTTYDWKVDHTSVGKAF